MTPSEALSRVQRLHDNLVGAKGKAQRRDREALAVLMDLVRKPAR